MSDDLTPKQARFVEEYLVDLNATQAAIRAGYSASGASVEGSRLLANAKICAAVAKARGKLSERTELTQDWVLDKLRENAERAMLATPVLSDKGEPIGVYTYQGSVANGALALLGKHLGMFVEKFENVTPISPAAREEHVLRLLTTAKARKAG